MFGKGVANHKIKIYEKHIVISEQIEFHYIETI